MFSIALIIPTIVMFLPFILAQSRTDTELYSAFECGFDNLNHREFHSHPSFFYYQVIFLIFDMELVILIPLIWGSNTMSIITFSSFLLVVLLGWLYEWREGSLAWNKTC
uniref:NADH-ubiquinone oxidoreductase chain 3 n=1 Tax=Siphonodentalium lobatum TaxID=203167 RepID=Q6VEH1_9MOLL|nr:NADH dehydrogenase subunit 3 [Siphonodentalium lobatum]AAP91677.1 NADH dehydrogenase subunit 3 [Siphonodentalium lobatum]